MDYNPPTQIDVVKIKPLLIDFIYFRKIVFENLDKLNTLERFKARLGFSPLALFFSKFLFNKFYICEDASAFGILRWGRIRSLFVSKACQNLGNGTALLNKIVEDSRAKHILVKPTKSSESFYLKNGFKKNGRLFIKPK